VAEEGQETHSTYKQLSINTNKEKAEHRTWKRSSRKQNHLDSIKWVQKMLQGTDTQASFIPVSGNS